MGVLGEPAHGLFTVLPGDDGTEKLVVARLETLLTRQLRQLVVDARPLVVPAQDESRFLQDFVPELRHKVGLGSSDASVPLPEHVPPVLQLGVAFHPGHRVDLDWSIRYEGGGQLRVFGLADRPERAAGRDLAAEADLLAALPLLAEQLARFQPDAREQAIIHIKYETYLAKEQQQATRMQELENFVIQGRLNYRDMPALSHEAREKLLKIQPETIGQASRISGVSPAVSP